MNSEVESRPARKQGKGSRKISKSTTAEPGAAAEPGVAEPVDQIKPHTAEPDATVVTPVDHQFAGAIEAILLSVDRPVSIVRLAEALGLLNEEEADAAEASDANADKKSRKRRGADSPLSPVRESIAWLNQQYETTGRAFRIEQVAGGCRLMTLPRFSTVIEEFLGKRERTSLSRAAIETLAIIAYKQPLTRAGLEAIRGVACGEVLKTLMDRRLVTITGRAEELGRPMLYGTTRQFLEAFGLATLKDLPSAAEFKARHAGGEPSDA